MVVLLRADACWASHALPNPWMRADHTSNIDKLESNTNCVTLDAGQSPSSSLLGGSTTVHSTVARVCIGLSLSPASVIGSTLPSSDRNALGLVVAMLRR